jgi:hypothetical protein
VPRQRYRCKPFFHRGKIVTQVIRTSSTAAAGWCPDAPQRTDGQPTHAQLTWDDNHRIPMVAQCGRGGGQRRWQHRNAQYVAAGVECGVSKWWKIAVGNAVVVGSGALRRQWRQVGAWQGTR